MALVTGFPARHPSSTRSIRFYKSDTTAGTNFTDDDNSFLFVDAAGANPFESLPKVTTGEDGSFDTTTVPPTPWGGGENDRAGTPPTSAPTKAYIWSYGIYVKNTGATYILEISFDGTNVHGRIDPGDSRIFYNRIEAGMAVRGVSDNTTYVVEAW